MDSAHITSIVVTSLVCGTIAIGVLAQAWVTRSRGAVREKGPATRLDALEERLYRLEQAIDTVAIEVERGTEAQRFTAKLLAERLEGVPTSRAGSRGHEA